jgi:hypothetical protein
VNRAAKLFLLVFLLCSDHSYSFTTKECVLVFTKIAKETVHYTFAPPVSLINAATYKLRTGKPLTYENIVPLAKRESKYLLGYAVLSLAMSQLSQMFYSVEMDDFISDSEKKMKKKPKKILVFFETTDAGLTKNADAYLSTLYKDNKNVSKFKFKGLSELQKILSELPQTNDVERMEFVFHGEPGIGFFEHNAICKDHIKELGPSPQIAAEDAEIRITSCNLADDTLDKSSQGEEFVNAFGEYLLPKGGQILATPKTIYILRKDADLINHHYNNTITFLIGGHPLRIFWEQIYPNLNKRNKYGIQDSVKFQIQPKSP